MYLSLDYGQKRIGVAISDESQKIATSLDFIANNSELKRISKSQFPKVTNEEILKIARKSAKKESKIEKRKVLNKILYLINCYYIQIILIGIPMSYDHKTGELIEGKQAKVCKSFAKDLGSFLKSQKILCEIKLLDESMSSVFANQNLSQMDISSSKIRNKIDSESARILLQEYLDNIQSNQNL